MISFKQFITEIKTTTLARYIAGRINQKPVDLRKNKKGGALEKREQKRRGSTQAAWGRLYKAVGEKRANEMVRMARKGLPLKEERLRSPIEILQRAARRYGPTIKGKVKDSEWGVLDKTKLIPLRGYNKKHANGAFDKLDEIPKDFPVEHNRQFLISDLHPGQEYVNISNPEKLNQKLKQKPENIVIATHNNKPTIIDGHHAIFAAWGRGEDYITANKHYNLDGFKRKPH